MDDYGYLTGKPDDGEYWETVDLNGQPVIVAAERLGETAQVVIYRDGTFAGGMCPVEWERAKAIAYDQFLTCEKSRT
jgi:hypothetical protein